MRHFKALHSITATSLPSSQDLPLHPRSSIFSQRHAVQPTSSLITHEILPTSRHLLIKVLHFRTHFNFCCTSHFSYFPVGERVESFAFNQFWQLSAVGFSLTPILSSHVWVYAVLEVCYDAIFLERLCSGKNYVLWLLQLWEEIQGAFSQDSPS